MKAFNSGKVMNGYWFVPPNYIQRWKRNKDDFSLKLAIPYIWVPHALELNGGPQEVCYTPTQLDIDHVQSEVKQMKEQTSWPWN